MVFVAKGARLEGDVEFGEGCGVWFNAVLRAEKRIRFGSRCNVQDCAVVHADSSDVLVGDNCTFGHGCVVDDSRVGNNCMVGMRAVVFGAELGDNCLVAAGSVVLPGKYSDNSFLAGVPAKRLRDVSEDNLKQIAFAAKRYCELAEKH